MGNEGSKNSKPDNLGINYATQRKSYSKSEIKLIPGSLVLSYDRGEREEEEKRRVENVSKKTLGDVLKKQEEE